MSGKCNQRHCRLPGKVRLAALIACGRPLPNQAVPGWLLQLLFCLAAGRLLAGPTSRPFIGFFEAEGVPFQVHNLRPVNQAVDEGHDAAGIGEHLLPVCERFVGRQDDGAGLGLVPL